MSNRFKKVSLSLYLDPRQSSSDRIAYSTLADWAKKRQQYAADPSAAVDLHNIVHVHKDIYLSGLFLHLLKPELATSLASSLSTDSIKEQVLIDVMSSHQIIGSQGGGEAIDQSQLLEAISQQVQTVLRGELAEQFKSSRDEIDSATHELKAQLNNEFAEQIQSSRSEIDSATNELKSQIERMEAERVRQLKQQNELVASNPQELNAELAEVLNSQVKEALQSHFSEYTPGSAFPAEVDTAALTEELASIVRQRDDEQQRQIAELSDLIKKQSQLLKKLSLNQPVTSANDDSGDSVDLNSPEQVEKRLANVQKMKKKRVF
ncbi:hypothetical protein [Vibrio sp. B1FLJ16]|uniref:hypothetical protein n=1 Tax=Vibrio sp. B1FLJ16 TaxID=2751178 RepID=UPI0015F6B40C|nr:hypothetical protein [Vibrio sp. B1FLJ16]CAD7812075.1 hypothetical protein ACOMICROBIO_EPCKBFOG_02450 [Vibrio sp. B1FLJ16]CAE6917941.1 hypothetical protein ACOMICROBIO_EPCKBFOG_02450 [Vibrio sp. B1FLJ16]